MSKSLTDTSGKMQEITWKSPIETRREWSFQNIVKLQCFGYDCDIKGSLVISKNGIPLQEVSTDSFQNKFEKNRNGKLVYKGGSNLVFTNKNNSNSIIKQLFGEDAESLREAIRPRQNSWDEKLQAFTDVWTYFDTVGSDPINIRIRNFTQCNPQKGLEANCDIESDITVYIPYHEHRECIDEDVPMS